MLPNIMGLSGGDGNDASLYDGAVSTYDLSDVISMLPATVALNHDNVSETTEFVSDETFSPGNATVGGFRKKRQNHNEVERKRRSVQKTKLEELRHVIPSLMLDKSSSVAIVVRAKEYIEQLRARVAELESYIAKHGDQKSMLTLPPLMAASPHHQQQQQSPHMMSPHLSMEQQQGQGGMPPSAYGMHSSIMQHAGGSHVHQPHLSVAEQQQRPEFVPTTRKRSRSPHNVLETPLSSSEDMHEVDKSGRKPRRNSSLLLPTSENGGTVLFGKRDSLQHLFAGPLPSVIEEANQLDINCGKCQRGINNLIMIDCDNCYGWYHIRCVGIDSSHIPTRWVCPECLPRVNAPGMMSHHQQLQ